MGEWGKDLKQASMDTSSDLNVFVDESGTNKRSDHSAFAFVYVSVRNLQEFESIVRKTEERIGVKAFHWAKSAWPVRERFFQELLKADFTVKVGIVRNPVSHPERELEKILLHLLVEPDIRTISIDGKKPKQYARRMKKVLRDKGLSTKKLRLVDDRQYAGVRVADALAGLVRAYFDGKPNRRVALWYERFRKEKIILILQ